MGNQRQKPPEMLVNQRGGRTRGLAVIEPAIRARPPAAPPGLSSYARSVWRDFWRAPVALVVDLRADKERLRHWIACVDERERISKLAINQPLLKGSKGNLVMNPLFRRMRELTRDIERAEEAFGMTPLSRFRLKFSVQGPRVKRTLAPVVEVDPREMLRAVK